jgi:hypothetical protein
MARVSRDGGVGTEPAAMGQNDCLVRQEQAGDERPRRPWRGRPSMTGGHASAGLVGRGAGELVVAMSG